MSGRRRAVCWSDLPPELLSKIAECLDSRAHIQQFRAVCKLWARAISPSVLTSKNILSPLFPYPLSHPSPWLDSPTQSQSPVLVSTCVFLLRSTLDPKLPPWLFAAEELHPGKLFVSKLLSPIAIKKLPTDFPRTLDFSYIQVSELAVFHRVRFADDPTDMFTKSHLSDFNHNRVVLFVHPSKISCPTIGIGDCTAMVLHNNGSLSAIRLKDGSELRVSLMMMKKFDDIVNFKGKIYAINRKGRAYMIHYYNTLSLTNITEETLVEDKRKRLAVSSDQQELFLIYRWCRNKTSGAVGFNIYKLNEQESKWERVKGFGDDRILFVTFDGCFFASANDFQGWKGNCIVFYSACFASYSSFLTKRDRNLSLLVYNLENDDCQYLASYQSQLFWPPPTWLSSHACMPKRQLESDKEMQPGSLSGPSTEPVDVEHHVTIQDVAEQVSDETKQSITSTEIDQSSKNNTSTTVKFHGFEVRSGLVPILQRIWSRHGNIIQESFISNGDIIARSLESLATVVQILESNTGQSINDGEADYLRSTLSDLRHMHFNVDWLASTVEKALALHKSKPMAVPLNNLLKLKAQATELRYKLMEKLDRVESQLNEGIAVLSGMVPFSEAEFEQLLGKGLI